MNEIHIAHIRQVQNENKRWAFKKYYYGIWGNRLLSGGDWMYKDSKQEVLDYFKRNCNIDGIVEGPATIDEIRRYAKERFESLVSDEIPVLNESAPKADDPRVKCPYCGLRPLQSTIDRFGSCAMCKFYGKDRTYDRGEEQQNTQKPMKVLITGGAGFIGYHLALKLKKEGHEVLCLDNFNDYYDVELKKHRARNLEKAGIKCVKDNAKDLDLVLRLIAKDEIFNCFVPDAVIHLAATAGVRHSLENPYEYIENNIVTTQKVIEACENHNIQKVIYASTSCTMAGNDLPWKEDVNPGHQLNPYGWSKRVNECQFKSSNIPCSVGLRFFTVYGPWGRPDMALFSFTDDIVKGNPITVFNNGDMVRDFTYVDDIVQGINLVLTKDVPNNEIYNIGRGEQVQLMDFVEYIQKYLGRKADIKYAPKHPADTKETWSCTDKLKALGYNPQTSIEEGVKNFIEWYKVYYGVE